MQTPEHELQGGHVHHRGERQEAADPGPHVASQIGNAAVERIVKAPGVQRSGGTGAQQLDESVARAIEERRGRGSALNESVRGDMEQALGQDLSDVRVHTDDTAHQLNEAVSARAFTAGSDVFFKQGTYDPSSSSGRELLGHELTHVVQQRTGTSGLQSGEVSSPSDPAEQHAESVGKALASNAPSVARHEEDTAEPAPAVAREEEHPDHAGEPVAVARTEDDDIEDTENPSESVARQSDTEDLDDRAL